MCVFSYARMTAGSCDLDLDPMTLIYELDLPTMSSAHGHIHLTKQ